MARTVVIAEDEAIVRLDLREILEEQGFDVVGETGRGDEAVEHAKLHRPDLVILDIRDARAGRVVGGERDQRRPAPRPCSPSQLSASATSSSRRATPGRSPISSAVPTGRAAAHDEEVALPRFNEMQALEAQNAALADDKRNLAIRGACLAQSSACAIGSNYVIGSNDLLEKPAYEAHVVQSPSKLNIGKRLHELMECAASQSEHTTKLLMEQLTISATETDPTAVFKKMQ